MALGATAKLLATILVAAQLQAVWGFFGSNDNASEKKLKAALKKNSSAHLGVITEAYGRAVQRSKSLARLQLAALECDSNVHREITAFVKQCDRDVTQAVYVSELTPRKVKCLYLNLLYTTTQNWQKSVNQTAEKIKNFIAKIGNYSCKASTSSLEDELAEIRRNFVVMGGEAERLLDLLAEQVDFFCVNTTKPCAAWATFNPGNSPQVNGIAAGQNPNGVTIYVGRTVQGDQILPGPIQLDDPAGITTTWRGNETFSSAAEYLVVPASCNCSWVNGTIARDHPGTVFTTDRRYYVSRYAWENDTVSLVRTDFYTFIQHVPDPGARNIEKKKQAREVLVCGTRHPPPAPVVEFFSSACGLWMPYGNNKMPTVNGFPVTTNDSGSQAYLIRGWRNDEFTPGLMRFNEHRHIDTGGFERHSIEYLMVPERCTCSWTAANESSVELVSMPGAKETFFVGRSKEEGDAVVRIAKAQLAADFEVLACKVNADASGERLE